MSKAKNQGKTKDDQAKLNLENKPNDNEENKPNEDETPALSKAQVALSGLERKIIDQAKRLAKNEISSCYDMVILTKKLIDIEDALL